MAKAITIMLSSNRPKDLPALEIVKRLAEKDGRSRHDVARRLIMAGAKVVEEAIK